MDAIMAAAMLTFGIAIHVAIWAIVIDWVNRIQNTASINWWGVVLGIAVLMIGSFLILTSIAIVGRAVMTSTGAV